MFLNDFISLVVLRLGDKKRVMINYGQINYFLVVLTRSLIVD